jgi:hypothetical protein
MWQKISLVAAIALLIVSRFVLATWNDSERQNEALRQATVRMTDFPLKLGPWQGEELAIDPDEVAQARLAGFCWRRYRHTVSGEVISVLLVCGRPGPISVHTPDVCYRGAGYSVSAAPKRTTFRPPNSPAGQFWTARFHKSPSAAPDNLNIAWSWNATGTWEAADNPRLSFAPHDVLVKLYVVADEAVAPGPFIDLLLPALAEVTAHH